MMELLSRRTCLDDLSQFEDCKEATPRKIYLLNSFECKSAVDFKKQIKIEAIPQPQKITKDKIEFNLRESNRFVEHYDLNDSSMIIAGITQKGNIIFKECMRGQGNKKEKSYSLYGCTPKSKIFWSLKNLNKLAHTNEKGEIYILTKKKSVLSIDQIIKPIISDTILSLLWMSENKLAVVLEKKNYIILVDLKKNENKENPMKKIFGFKGNVDHLTAFDDTNLFAIDETGFFYHINTESECVKGIINNTKTERVLQYAFSKNKRMLSVVCAGGNLKIFCIGPLGMKLICARVSNKFIGSFFIGGNLIAAVSLEKNDETLFQIIDFYQGKTKRKATISTEENVKMHFSKNLDQFLLFDAKGIASSFMVYQGKTQRLRQHIK